MKFFSHPATKIFSITGFLTLLASAVIFFFGNNKDLANFLAQIGVLAGLIAIGIQTIHEMNDSTKNQLESLNKAVDALIEVSESLKAVVEDIKKKNDYLPKLYIAFGPHKRLKEITLASGKESTINLMLGNSGEFNASNTQFRIFFPPEFIVVSAGRFRTILQSSSSIYPGHTMLSFDDPRTSYGHNKFNIKVRTNAESNGEHEIPYVLTCDNAPRISGTLKISLIG